MYILISVYIVVDVFHRAHAKGGFLSAPYNLLAQRVRYFVPNFSEEGLLDTGFSHTRRLYALRSTVYIYIYIYIYNTYVHIHIYIYI